MIHRSISHWGVFEEPDTDEYENVFFEGDGALSKVEDDKPFRHAPMHPLPLMWFVDSTTSPLRLSPL